MAKNKTQRETVVGVFQTRDQAQRAIEELKSAGFRGEDIGVLMQNREGAKDLAGETGTKAGQAAGVGATTGGVLGALGGLLVGLGALAIPGIGPVLAAGPLVAALGPIVGGTATGAVIGAGAGAIAGALVGLGIPEDEAQVYEQRFQEGGILVTVKAGTNRYNEAEQIMRNAGAEDIEFGQSATGANRGQTYTQGQTYAQGQSYTQGQTANTGYTQNQSGIQGQETGTERTRVPLVEENINVNKGVREAGEVAIGKRVVEEQVNVPVNVSHEEVTVSRHAVDRPVQAGEAEFGQDQVIRVPVREETVDVQKQARVKEEVEINKQVVNEQRNVQDTVRREELDMDTQGNVQARNQGRQSGATTNQDVNTETPYNPNDNTSYNQ
jgi:uncharacterized protein (TIGR02271 family)